jgi:hypothetical protein
MSRQIVRTCLAWAALSAVLAGGFAQSATAAVKTTIPGVVYVVPMTVTDKKVTVPRDKFSKGLTYSRYPRGAVIRYKVINKGTRPYSVKIWDATTTVIRPGDFDTILLNWNYRGNYTYATLFHGKPIGPHGRVKIF